MDEQNQVPAPGSGGGMGKTIGIVIGIIVVGGLVWFFLGRKPGNNSQTTSGGNQVQSGSQNAATETTVSKNGSFKDLLASGIQEKCDFTTASTTGRIYVGGDKIRGYFSVLVNGTAESSNLLNDGQTAYVWVDGQTTGYKMSASAMMDKPSTAPNGKSSVDANAKYDYTCTERGVGSDVFQLPGGVTFTDMSSMMQGAMSASSSSGSMTGSGGASGSAGMKAQQCAACDSLSGSSKNQCRAALACP